MSKKSNAQAFQLKAMRSLPGAIYGLMQPTVLAIVSPGEIVERLTTDPFDQLHALLSNVLPQLDELADYGIRKVNPTQAIAHVKLAQELADLVAALQLSVGQPVSRGRVLPSPADASLHVAVPYFSRDCGEAAVRTALDIVNNCLTSLGEDASATEVARKFIDDAVKHYREQHAGKTPVATTVPLIRLAQKRDIPWYGLPGDILQLGQGIHSQRLSGTFTSRTGNIAARIARQKPLGAAILRAARLPVPDHIRASTKDKALEAAEELGYPVVIKPADKDGGIDVFAGLTTPAAVSAAFDKTMKNADSVLVERHIEGDDYRLLVVNGRMISAIHRQPGGVVGDGVHTIDQLVEIFNQDPRRGAGKDNLVPLELDEEAVERIAEAGFERGSVVPEGTFVSFRRRASLHTGGTPTSVTKIIHPDNRELAERACRIVGLDIAGIDFLCPDISRSWKEAGGAICEVNGQPVLRGHWFGDPDVPVNEIIMDYLFPKGRGRIPIIAVAGTRCVNAICARLQGIFDTVGITAGLATENGAWIGHQQINRHDSAGFAGAKALLIDPATQAAVLQMTEDSLVREGVAFDFCTVASVTGHDHRTEDGMKPGAQLSPALQALLQRARRAVVLNADGELKWPQPGIQARNAIFVSERDNNPLLTLHVSRGGRAVVLKSVDGKKVICHLTSGAQHILVDCAELPVTKSTTGSDACFAAAFASALAWAAGIRPGHIQAGLLKESIAGLAE